MNDAKHTPGPWHIEIVSPYVAEVHSAEGPVATHLTHAEARLIAAAPALLDALQGMLNAYSNTNLASVETRLQAMDAADTAIAAATGKAGES